MDRSAGWEKTMIADRYNFYRNIHKAVRGLLADLVQRAGRTDYTDTAAVDELELAVMAGFDALQSHADHEDRFIEPLVRAAAPHVALELDAVHARHHEQMPALLAALRAVRAAGPLTAQAGHAFTVALSRFAGEQLLHMADEEEKAMTALWGALDDAGLLEVERALVASLTPAEMGKVVALMLPALNAPERAELLGGARANAPAPVFAGLMEIARGALTAAEFARLQRDLETASAA